MLAADLESLPLEEHGAIFKDIIRESALKARDAIFAEDPEGESAKLTRYNIGQNLTCQPLSFHFPSQHTTFA